MLVFLFTDIEGSSRLWEEHTGVMTAVIARHDEILRELVSGHGGHITKPTSDGITAVFQTAGQPLIIQVYILTRRDAFPVVDSSRLCHTGSMDVQTLRDRVSTIMAIFSRCCARSAMTSCEEMTMTAEFAGIERRLDELSERLARLQPLRDRTRSDFDADPCVIS